MAKKGKSKAISYLESFTNKLKPTGKKVALFVATSSLPEVFLISSYVIARYLNNADFSYPSEIVLDIVLFAALASGIFYLLKFALRRFGLLPAHLAALAVSYQLYAYTTAYPRLVHALSHVIPNTTPFGRAVLLILLCTIVFALAAVTLVQVLKKYAPNAVVPLFKILVFTVSFMFASQLWKMGVQMWKIRHELTYKQPSLQLKQDKSKIVSKPNIYYIVFDRYASADTLKSVYNFDNSSTLSFLSENGFYTRETSLSNYPFTMQSIGSTLRMGYHADLHSSFKDSAKPYQAGFPYRAFLDNPPAVQALKQNGYSYNMVSSWWDFTRKSPSADYEPSRSYRLRILGKTFWVSDLQRDMINKSVLSPLLLKGLTIGNKTVIKYDLDRNFEQIFHEQMDALDTIVTDTKIQKAPQVTFAHVLLPHDPYLFMPDGSSVKYNGERTDDDIDEYTKYTNQLTYANKQLEKLVTNIRTHDPSAVVLLQTDEGPYPKEFRGTQTAQRYYTPLLLSNETMKKKFGSLASYYLPGVSNEEAADNMTSHINAFRFILRHYLGYDLPNLPDCHYAVGAKFNLYDYKDVTKIVDPANTADCSQYL